MTKIEFLLELDDRLKGLYEDDREASCQFYGEMIDDRIEDGMSEEEAVADLGSIDDIVKQIIAEIPISRIIKTKMKATKRLGVAAIVALIFGGLILLPIGISLLAAFLAVYVTMWSLVISLYSVAISFSACGIASVFMLILSITRGQIAGGLFVLGAGALLLGLSIPLYSICKGFAKAMWSLSRYVLRKIKAIIKTSLLKGGKA